VSEKTQKELGKFFLVGVVATALDYLLLNLFAVWFRLPVLIANSLSAPLSSYVSYKLNKRVVFEDRMHGQRKTLILYVAIVGFGILVIQNTFIHLLQDSLALTIAETVAPLLGSLGLSVSERTISINVAKVGASLIMALWNFYMLRRFVFITKDETDDS